MRKIFLAGMLVFLTVLGFAQRRDTVRLREIQRNEGNIVTDRAPQAVYFQLGGPSPIISVNYDRRFGKRVNGPGFAAGLGYWGIEGVSVFSIPASLNYLFGRNSHFLEAAGGGTFISASTNLFDTRETGSGVIWHLTLGYRYQPTRGGFFFRGGYAQLFAAGETVPFFYLGFGHNF